MFNEFFISEKHRVIFALLYTDTATRSTLLDMKEELYHDKDKAVEWKNNLINILHSGAKDSYHEDKIKRAINEVEFLYNNMIVEDDEEED